MPTAALPPPVLALADISVTRGAAWQVGLARLELRAGEAAALVGPSGCGKTTLLRALLGLEAGTKLAGSITLGGLPLPPAGSDAWRSVLRSEVLWLPQEGAAALDPLSRVEVQVGRATGAGPSRCAAALAGLGVGDPDAVLERYPHELSGGQAERVLLAIACLRRPRLLIADEPGVGLDATSQAMLRAGLARLRRDDGTALLIATHDLDLLATLGARSWCHRGDRFVPAPPSPHAWPAVAAAGGDGSAEPPVLRAFGLKKAFSGTPVLAGVDLAVAAGEVLAVVGPSGCGKTTLARILAGHLRPDAGRIEGGAAVQMLGQAARATLTPQRRLGSLVAESAVRGFVVAAEAAALGLPAPALRRTAAALSAGECRRGALLRALSVRPRVLVLDEPTASLDGPTAQRVMEMLMAVRDRHRCAMILITHDRALAGAHADRWIDLEGGTT